MNELTQQEVDSMHWLDEQGIGFLPPDKGHEAYERDYGQRHEEDGNAIVGVVNVAKFYLCCYLIMKVVQLGVRFIR